MTLAKVKEKYIVHEKFNKTYKGRLIDNIERSLGNSPFQEGEEVFVVIARREDDDGWTAYMTSLTGKRDYVCKIEKAPTKVVLDSACGKDPYEVIDDTITSHNNRVF